MLCSAIALLLDLAAVSFILAKCPVGNLGDCDEAWILLGPPHSFLRCAPHVLLSV